MDKNRILPTGKILPQLKRAQALKLAKSKEWEKWDDERIVRFQLYQDRLCMDFDRFHKAIEKVLGRPIWTHEFAQINLIRLEYEGIRKKPTLGEIMGQIPREKLILAVISPNHDSEAK